MPELLYEAYICHTPVQTEFATRLSNALRGRGCTTYSDMDVLVGERPDSALDEGLRITRC